MFQVFILNFFYTQNFVRPAKNRLVYLLPTGLILSCGWSKTRNNAVRNGVCQLPDLTGASWEQNKSCTKTDRLLTLRNENKAFCTKFRIDFSGYFFVCLFFFFCFFFSLIFFPLTLWQFLHPRLIPDVLWCFCKFARRWPEVLPVSEARESWLPYRERAFLCSRSSSLFLCISHPGTFTEQIIFLMRNCWWLCVVVSVWSFLATRIWKVRHCKINTRAKPPAPDVLQLIQLFGRAGERAPFLSFGWSCHRDEQFLEARHTQIDHTLTVQSDSHFSFSHWTAATSLFLRYIQLYVFFPKLFCRKGIVYIFCRHDSEYLMNKLVWCCTKLSSVPGKGVEQCGVRCVVISCAALKLLMTAALSFLHPRAVHNSFRGAVQPVSAVTRMPGCYLSDTRCFVKMFHFWQKYP